MAELTFHEVDVESEEGRKKTAKWNIRSIPQLLITDMSGDLVAHAFRPGFVPAKEVLKKMEI